MWIVLTPGFNRAWGSMNICGVKQLRLYGNVSFPPEPTGDPFRYLSLIHI